MVENLPDGVIWCVCITVSIKLNQLHYVVQPTMPLPSVSKLIRFLVHLAIHSMEQGICPIVVLYFAINVLSSKRRTVVGQQLYKFYHRVIVSPFWVTWRQRSCDRKIHSGQFPVGGPLTSNLFRGDWKCKCGKRKYRGMEYTSTET